MNEKNLVWKRTLDGVFHLYLNDPARQGFQKLEEGSKLKVIKDKTHILLSNGDGFCTLWCIIKNSAYKATLPQTTQVRILSEHTIYNNQENWYAIIPNKSGGWHAVLLGKEFETFLSTPDNIKYKRLYLSYFLRKDNEKNVELVRFIDEKVVISDKYQEIVEYGAKLIALRHDCAYDIFDPDAEQPLTGKKNEAFNAFAGLFAWSSKQKGWIFHSNCNLFGKNAAHRTLQDGTDQIKQLYRIDDGEIYLVAEGDWRWGINPYYLCVDEMCYILNEETELVDFDHPKPTLKKKIKNFFKFSKTKKAAD